MTEFTKEFCALVLAAGKGTRMKSNIPKVLQSLLHKPLIYYPLNSLAKADIENISVVVGYQGEMIEKYINSSHPNIGISWQREQLGTGHAVKLAADWWRQFKNVLIVAGDTPLITSETISSFIAYHKEKNNDCSIISFDLLDPTGYGRLVRGDNSIRIVEQKDATEDEIAIKEVNSGVYIFKSEALLSIINDITADNNQKEYYLPDAVSLLQSQGKIVDAIKMENFEEFLGINSPQQLSDVSLLLRDRILDQHLALGVKVVDRNSTWIGPDVLIENDVFIEPNVQLWGNTSIGTGTTVGSFSCLDNVVIGDNVTIVSHVRIINSIIGQNSSVGPFVFMRENAELMDDVHVGRFVEIKKSKVSSHSKVPHLSYIGDTEIGQKTNIGAGTITCNYDGAKKHKTNIGDNCFIGSNTILVAPVKIGDNATTAAGSTITKDVPAESLAIARSKQIIIDNWYSRSNKLKGGL
ncbi:MAG: bifunctional UDP-N-acetylglucosamine diphosphorylase/glucosamine-1-phosphate N-acetyltransferase GlmU [Synergistaceae bacterium]